MFVHEDRVRAINGFFFGFGMQSQRWEREVGRKGNIFCGSRSCPVVWFITENDFGMSLGHFSVAPLFPHNVQLLRGLSLCLLFWSAHIKWFLSSIKCLLKAVPWLYYSMSLREVFPEFLCRHIDLWFMKTQYSISSNKPGS